MVQPATSHAANPRDRRIRDRPRERDAIVLLTDAVVEAAARPVQRQRGCADRPTNNDAHLIAHTP